MLPPFIEHLTALRKKRKLTQNDLANVLQLTQEAVSRYEAGKSLPCTENIALLATLLGTSTDYLLELSEQDSHLSR